MTKDRPEGIRHSEGDVLPFAVWQYMLLLAYPPFGGFDATTAASPRLTALIEISGIGTTGAFALIEMCLLRWIAQVPFREKSCLS